MSESDKSALRNILGWAAGIAESSKDEASRKVAGWIVELAEKALAASPSASAAIMPELSTVELQELICDNIFGEWRREDVRTQARCRGEAADLYDAIRASLSHVEKQTGEDESLLCPKEWESETEHFDPAGYDANDCAGCGRPKSEHAARPSGPKQGDESMYLPKGGLK